MLPFRRPQNSAATLDCKPRRVRFTTDPHPLAAALSFCVERGDGLLGDRFERERSVVPQRLTVVFELQLLAGIARGGGRRSGGATRAANSRKRPTHGIARRSASASLPLGRFCMSCVRSFRPPE